MRLAVMVLAALVAICPNTQAAIQYVFKESEYTIDETGTSETPNVELIRTCSAADPNCAITGQTTVEINTVCPTECETMPGVSVATEGAAIPADYTFNNMVTFSDSTVTDQAVSLTVHDDDIEEKREYFCLSVVNPALRGTQWYTKVIIPWNDHCVLHHSPSDGGSTAASRGYNIKNSITAVEGYVGPWSHTDMPTLTIEVTPQTDANGAGVESGQDINIFLSDIPDTSSATFNYYAIFLDNANAADAIFGTLPLTADDSFVTKTSQNTLVDAGAVEPMANEQVIADVTNTLELQFTYASSSSSATINIQRTASTENPSTSSTALDASDTTTAINIGHLFVSAAVGKYADWKICGLVPRRLRAVDGGAIASGHVSEFHAGRAIDGVRDPNGKCFVSADDLSSKNWLRIDLGRVLHVQKVIIFPVVTVAGISDDASMNSARVYVGSCNPTDVFADTSISSRMNVCNEDILVAAGLTIVEVTCAASAYGQYVYILPDVDGTPFSLCEVEVYGDEIPIDMESKVEFTKNTFDVTEGTAQAALTLTRSGSGNTCTYVDYHTSDIDTGDITVIPSTSPNTLSWLGSSAAAEQTINVDITQDDLCEPPETVNVYLTNVVGANLGTLCYSTVNIADDDSMTYTIVPPSSSISEGAGPLSIDVTRTGTGINQEGRALVMFTDISATSNDYANIPLQIPTFESTSASSTQTKSGSLPIKTDECWEESETFSVALGDLSPSTCSQSGTTSPVVVEIMDDDSKFSWDIISDTKTITIKEGSGTRDVTIKRTGVVQSKKVEFTVARDSAETDDFSISPSSEVTFQSSDDDETITISVADDNDVEETETFTLTLRDPLDPLGENCCNGNLEDPYRITVQITDNDAEYFWKESSYSIEEGENLVVCLERTGDTTTTQAVDIAYSTTSSAQSGFDFTPLTRITFSGTPEACMDVPIISDGTPEGTETFTLTIDPANSIQIGSDNVLTVTITDDDAIISWVESTYTVSENRNVAVAIEKEGNVAVSVSVSTNAGTATPGLDFIPVSRVIPIAASQSTYEFEIDIVDDDEDDNDETFSLTLSSVGSSLGTVTIVSPAVTTIRITDDDPTPTVPPVDDDGLSGGAIAGIVVAAVIGALVIIGAVVFLLFMAGGGAGAGAGAAGAAGVGGTGGAPGAYGGQQGMQLANYGYPDANAYGLQNFSFGNGYGNNTGFNNFGGNRQFGY